jgi:hypothetical protein
VKIALNFKASRNPLAKHMCLSNNICINWYHFHSLESLVTDYIAFKRKTLKKGEWRYFWVKIYVKRFFLREKTARTFYLFYKKIFLNCFTRESSQVFCEYSLGRRRAISFSPECHFTAGNEGEKSNYCVF